MSSDKYKAKAAAQQASNKEFFKNNPGASISNGKRIIHKPDRTPKIKPAIKPNPTAGLVASNSNFQGLRDQLNSDRLTGGALGNINPAGNNTLSGLAGLAAPAADRIKPAMPPVKPTLSPNAAGGLINNLNSTGGGMDLATQLQNSKSPELLASLGNPPASIADQRMQMQNNPIKQPTISAPPGKVIQQAATPEQEAAQRASIEASRKNMNITTGPDGQKFNTMRLGQAQPVPATPPSPVAPAPTTIGPAQQMQAQKDQMFPPAPATPAAPAASAAPIPPKPAAPITPAPVAPPVAPKPSQITPPAGVTKSQADIDEEKKKLQAAAGSPV